MGQRRRQTTPSNPHTASANVDGSGTAAASKDISGDAASPGPVHPNWLMTLTVQTPR